MRTFNPGWRLRNIECLVFHPLVTIVSGFLGYQWPRKGHWGSWGFDISSYMHVSREKEQVREDLVFARIQNVRMALEDSSWEWIFFHL